MRVLVIEDAEVLRRSVLKALTETGYSATGAADGEQGLAEALMSPFDAIVLDLMLPRLDGQAVLKRLRAEGVATPVLVLTARDALDDRVSSLDAGADDYLVKPFAVAELLARVRAIVRRRYSATSSLVRVDGLVLDVAARRVTYEGREVVLSAREFALLEYLVSRKGHVVTRDEIWTHVYDFAADRTSNVIDVHVGSLRKKLGAGAALIQTRRGIGYFIEDTP